jgi:hypothetical protein
VIGLIATSLTAGLPSLIVGLRFIEKNYGVTVDWSSSARILVSSAVAASVTYLAISQLSLSSWIELVLGVLIFLIVVVPSILLTKSLNPDDIKNLRGMTSGLGVVGRLLSRVLNILERLMKMLKM